ncbi:MAG TPA: RNA 2',3'-cyclic phosphodiesterase [Phycisphaerae bacterium]|nr:RNA 2',3'-cyclic phosphodiesterase [Phycisphaerae bacterium]
MRAFIAIELADPIKRALGKLQERLSRECSGLRWVKPEQIHLTLAFLGEIKDSQIVEISGAVGRATASCADFEFGVEGLGVFPPRGRVNVVWAGVADEAGALSACHQRLYEQLGELGFTPDRGNFAPHLTLARVRDPRASHGLREIIAAQAAPRIGTQPAGGLTFFESILGSSGPQHRALSHHKLSG